MKSLLLIILLLLFQSCINRTTFYNRKVKILFLGESTSLGVGASTPVNGFVYRMIDSVKKTGIDLDYRILAKRGMNSTWGIAQINQIISYRPDIIIIDFFINDQLLSDDQIRKNYTTLSNIPYGYIILFDLYDLNSFNKYKSMKLSLNERPNFSTRWAKVIDTINYIPSNWEIYLSDGTHPNDPGYGILGDLLFKETYEMIFNLTFIGKLIKD